MADDKKAGEVTLLNRGKRHYDFGKDANGNSRVHAPGATMTYSAEQAASLAGYKELADISKLPGQIDTTALKSDNAKLLNENEELKKQLASLEAVKVTVKVDGRKKKEEIPA